MTDLKTVEAWIRSLERGSDSRVGEIWESYFKNLVEYASCRIHPREQRTYDAEDAALSAFNSFIQGVRGQRFSDLMQPDSIWRILMTITFRKIVNRRRYQQRHKRGGIEGGNQLRFGEPCNEISDLSLLLSRGPTPEMAAEVRDEFARVFQLLEDESLQTILLLKLSNYSTDEIAIHVGCARSTVNRKLQYIRARLRCEGEA